MTFPDKMKEEQSLQSAANSSMSPATNFKQPTAITATEDKDSGDHVAPTDGNDDDVMNSSQHSYHRADDLFADDSLRFSGKFISQVVTSF